MSTVIKTVFVILLLLIFWPLLLILWPITLAVLTIYIVIKITDKISNNENPSDQPSNLQVLGKLPLKDYENHTKKATCTRIRVGSLMPDELYVSKIFKTFLNNGNYAVINDVLLPSNGNTKTSQIDHIVISIHGIFCIENKSHNGLIFGSRNGKKWTQCLGHSKYYWRNPFLQNYAHLKAIEDTIGNDKLKAPIHSLIVFPSASNITVDDSDEVGHMSDILDKIFTYKEKIYKYSECQEMIRQILLANISDEQSRIEHVREVRELIATTQN